MSNGIIISPLIPDENIEVNRGSINDNNSSNDSVNNQKKEVYKFDIKNFCKKLKCLEIIFLFFLFIIILLIITRIIIQLVYHIFPIITLVYGLLSLVSFWSSFEILLQQKYDDNGIILLGLFANVLAWCSDFFSFEFKNYNIIKSRNEFIVNFFKYLEFAEISIWVLIICLFMYLAYKKSGKICSVANQQDS